MSKKVNHFEAERAYPQSVDTTLSLIISALIPATISALETRSSRSFWASDADYSRAYQAVKRQQWELLMDATDRIVSEIRATRMGTDTPVEMRNPAIDPFTIDLISLNDIVGSLNTNGKSAAFILEEVRAILEATAAGDEESLGALLRIAAVIAGAPPV